MVHITTSSQGNFMGMTWVLSRFLDTRQEIKEGQQRSEGVVDERGGQRSIIVCIIGWKYVNVGGRGSKCIDRQASD